jgi:hypothetical protein
LKEEERKERKKKEEKKILHKNVLGLFPTHVCSRAWVLIDASSLGIPDEKRERL